MTEEQRSQTAKDQADLGAAFRARPPQQCDAVICLIGTAYGSGPHDPITKAEQPFHGLKDPRTKGRIFSYTQLQPTHPFSKCVSRCCAWLPKVLWAAAAASMERCCPRSARPWATNDSGEWRAFKRGVWVLLLIARDLGRPIYTFFIKGDELPTAFAPEPPELAQRQQAFITEFAKDGRNTYGTFSQWDQPADHARGLKQAIEAIKFEITVLAGKPTNLPYTSLGTLFKGRDEFLAALP